MGMETISDSTDKDELIRQGWIEQSLKIYLWIVGYVRAW